MKEETLEEAAREYWKRGQFGLEKAADTERAFLKGGLWQTERMYYEEEVVDLIADWTKMAKGLNMNFPADKFEEWFKQFKKK